MFKCYTQHLVLRCSHYFLLVFSTLTTVYHLFRPRSFSYFHYPLSDDLLPPFPNALFLRQCFLLVLMFHELSLHSGRVFFNDFQNGVIALQESMQGSSLRYRKKILVQCYSSLFKNLF